uniref:NK2 homeobox 2a n=1 Tax=Xiphophorus couchianus TaxID=32473 RepID=A0A3B5M0A1_9TELE
MSLTNTKTGFSVKDILDLPDTNDEDGSITGAEEDTEGSETASTTKNGGVLVQSPLENVQNLPLKNPFYDSTDNPYTRWLATTDSIQYSLHGLSASSQDSAKSPEPSADDESPDNDKETSSSGGSDSGKNSQVKHCCLSLSLPLFLKEKRIQNSCYIYSGRGGKKREALFTRNRGSFFLDRAMPTTAFSFLFAFHLLFLERERVIIV